MKNLKIKAEQAVKGQNTQDFVYLSGEKKEIIYSTDYGNSVFSVAFTKLLNIVIAFKLVIQNMLPQEMFNKHLNVYINFVINYLITNKLLVTQLSIKKAIVAINKDKDFAIFKTPFHAIKDFTKAQLTEYFNAFELNAANQLDNYETNKQLKIGESIMYQINNKWYLAFVFQNINGNCVVIGDDPQFLGLFYLPDNSELCENPELFFEKDYVAKIFKAFNKHREVMSEEKGKFMKIAEKATNKAEKETNLIQEQTDRIETLATSKDIAELKIRAKLGRKSSKFGTRTKVMEKAISEAYKSKLAELKAIDKAAKEEKEISKKSTKKALKAESVETATEKAKRLAKEKTTLRKKFAASYKTAKNIKALNELHKAEMQKTKNNDFKILLREQYIKAQKALTVTV